MGFPRGTLSKKAQVTSMVRVRLSASKSTVSTLPEKGRFFPANAQLASWLLMPSMSAQSTAPLYNRTLPTGPFRSSQTACTISISTLSGSW